MNECTSECSNICGDQTWIGISKKLGEEKAIQRLRSSQAWEVYTKGVNFQYVLTSKVLRKWNNRRLSDYSFPYSADSHSRAEPTFGHVHATDVSKVASMWRHPTSSYSHYANSVKTPEQWFSTVATNQTWGALKFSIPEDTSQVFF